MPENQDIIGTALTSQLIFVDFDGTICLHLKPVNYFTVESLLQDTALAYQSVFKDSLVNTWLRSFLYDMQIRGSTIVLLTSASSNALMLKQKWLDEHCPGLFTDAFAVQTHADKISFAEAFNKARGYAGDVMIIDDSSDVLRKAYERGITAYSPQILFELSKQ